MNSFLRIVLLVTFLLAIINSLLENSLSSYITMFSSLSAFIINELRLRKEQKGISMNVNTGDNSKSYLAGNDIKIGCNE